eukprot:1926190-Rhodomonas_salina.1
MAAEALSTPGLASHREEKEEEKPKAKKKKRRQTASGDEAGSMRLSADLVLHFGAQLASERLDLLLARCSSTLLGLQPLFHRVDQTRSLQLALALALSRTLCLRPLVSSFLSSLPSLFLPLLASLFHTLA